MSYQTALEFLADCSIRDTDPVSRLQEERPDLVAYFVARGISHLSRDKKYRQLRELKLRDFDPVRYEREMEEKDASEERLRRDLAETTAKMCADIQGAVNKYVQTIFDEWMVGGVRLGDTTRAILLDHAEREERSADGHYKNARFYTALAERCTEGKRLRDSVDAFAVEGIRASIYVSDDEEQRKAA